MTGNAQYSWFWFCAPLVNDANVHPCGIDTRAYCAYFKINVSTLAEEVMKAYTFFSFSSKFLFFFPNIWQAGWGKQSGSGSKMVTVDHDETRTRNLLIRSQTPYPLGHAVNA